jgi:hypothetical protein
VFFSHTAGDLSFGYEGRTKAGKNRVSFVYELELLGVTKAKPEKIG